MDSLVDRAILHSDMNSFYASVEQAEHPELRGKPVVVAGKEELRHGIVLTKSIEAKAYGIETADTLWQARRKCPGLIVLPPHYNLYKRYSEKARAIYYSYTDQVEPFGLDEAWLDVTGSLGLLGLTPVQIAREISDRVKLELGCTVSVGVSWNKIFAKFGSDYRKPDAVTVIDRGNYRDVVWVSPVRDLLYVGPATERKLHAAAIETIGDLAHASDIFLRRRLGKMGFVLRTFARGEDATPVKRFDPDYRDVIREVKSYGNGLTAPHPITTAEDAKALIWLLSESVAQRMREDGMRAGTVSIGVRNDIDLGGYGCQTKLPRPSAATRHIAQTAWAMLSSRESFGEDNPIRALHVRASDLVALADADPDGSAPNQLSLFDNAYTGGASIENGAAGELRQGSGHDRGYDRGYDREYGRGYNPEHDWEELDRCIDDLRRRYGNKIVVRGCELVDPEISMLDIKDENTVHPMSYFHR